MPVMHIVSVQMLCILYIKHKNTSTDKQLHEAALNLNNKYIVIYQFAYSEMEIFVYAANYSNTNMTEKISVTTRKHAIYRCLLVFIFQRC